MNLTITISYFYHRKRCCLFSIVHPDPSPIPLGPVLSPGNSATGHLPQALWLPGVPLSLAPARRSEGGRERGRCLYTHPHHPARHGSGGGCIFLPRVTIPDRGLLSCEWHSGQLPKTRFSLCPSRPGGGNCSAQLRVPGCFAVLYWHPYPWGHLRGMSCPKTLFP